MFTRSLAVALVAVPLAANALDFSMKLEPGVSVALSAPQNEVYSLGVGQTAKMLFGITSFLDVGERAVHDAAQPLGRPGSGRGLGSGPGRTSETLGTTSVFKGTVMADQAVTLLTGATLDGRALARTAAVDLDSNLVTRP